MEYFDAKSDTSAPGVKRTYAVYKEANSDSIERSKFKPFRSKERDSQLRLTTQQSPFVEGEESARLIWAKTLDAFSGSKRPSKFIEIPPNIHDELAYVGNHLRACAQQSADDEYRFKRNILIPYVSFVVKRETTDSLEKCFIPGSYINFDPEKYSNCATAFISGGDSMPWAALNHYNTYRKKHNRDPDQVFDLPFIRVFSGREVEKRLGKTLPSAEQATKSQVDCLYHTEEMFYELLLANPKAIVSIAQEVLCPIDEIVHVVFDFYSWWDVCRPCQKRFRTEYFRGDVHKKLEQGFDEGGFSFPKESGILPIFRVSSYKQHHPDSLQDMDLATSGIPGRCGFEAKALSQAQIVLSTRKTTGAFNYPAICQKVRAF
jgi:hypothetical protein